MTRDPFPDRAPLDHVPAPGPFEPKPQSQRDILPALLMWALVALAAVSIWIGWA